jgi:hypothetical protein
VDPDPCGWTGGGSGWMDGETDGWFLTEWFGEVSGRTDGRSVGALSVRCPASGSVQYKQKKNLYRNYPVQVLLVI